MQNQNNIYFKNLLVSLGSGIGLLIAFQAFGLEFMKSIPDFFVWLIWLINFFLFMIILKSIFYSIKLKSVMDGVWGGIVLYIWSPILRLPFIDRPLDAIAALSIYLIFGIIVIFLGYIFRIRDSNL